MNPINSVYKHKHLKYINNLYTSKKISLKDKNNYIKNIDKYIKQVRDQYNNKHIYEWKDTNLHNIELSVGLPLFKSKKIVWLALESLKNQISVNFQWELLIIEEDGYSLDIIKKFVNKLPNCKRIYYEKYKKSNNNIPITNKWINIAKKCSKTSKIIVLQDSDDYSPTERLHNHYEHFKNNNCLISSQLKGIFYNLKSKKTILYDGSSRKTFTNLNHAILIKDLLKMEKNKYNGVHQYLHKSVKNNNKIKDKYIFFTEDDNFLTGFFTDGYNSISLTRKNYYDNPSGLFFNNNYKLNIPSNVSNFISRIKTI